MCDQLTTPHNNNFNAYHLEEWSDGLRCCVDVGVQISISVRSGDQGQVPDGDPVPVVIQAGPGKCFFYENIVLTSC